jgi:hypothetical protein
VSALARRSDIIVVPADRRDPLTDCRTTFRARIVETYINWALTFEGRTG